MENTKETPSNYHPIVITLAADDFVWVPLYLTVYSLLLNYRGVEKIAFCIFEHSISNRHKEKIEKLINKFQSVLTWYPIDKNLYTPFKKVGHLTFVAFSRLRIGEYLPKIFHKTIYLDVDLIVLRSIDELWNQNMGNNIVLAVPENGRADLSSYQTLCECGGPFFNTGVLLIDLDKWRTENIGARAYKFAANHKHELKDQDQLPLNAILKERWGHLDPAWNWQQFDSAGQRLKFASCLPKKVAILHFNTSSKPWNEPYVAFSKTFFSYMRRAKIFTLELFMIKKNFFIRRIKNKFKFRVR